MPPGTARWQRVRVPNAPTLTPVLYDLNYNEMPTALTIRDEWRLVTTSGADLTFANNIVGTAATVYAGIAGQYTAIGTASEWKLRYMNDWVTTPYYTNLTTTIDENLLFRQALSPEEQAKQALRAKNDVRRREIAVIRARRLMQEHLTAQELDQLAEKDYFEVSSSSGRRYRIYRGHSRNVVELDKLGREVNRLCAYSREGGRMPDEDHMVIQKLMLMTDEEAYRKVANHSPIHVPNSPLELAA